MQQPRWIQTQNLDEGDQTGKSTDHTTIHCVRSPRRGPQHVVWWRDRPPEWWVPSPPVCDAPQQIYINYYFHIVHKEQITVELILNYI